MDRSSAVVGCVSRPPDDVMLEHLARFTGEEGVLFIGRAQVLVCIGRCVLVVLLPLTAR